MKALEILKEVNEQINMSKDYGFIMEVYFNEAYQTRVNEAIKELQEVKNKKCETCIYLFDNQDLSGDCDYDDKRSYNDTPNHIRHIECIQNFYCSKWKAIENEKS